MGEGLEVASYFNLQWSKDNRYLLKKGNVPLFPPVPVLSINRRVTAK
jgi:hypothetical protein